MALQLGVLRELGFPLSGIPPMLRTDPTGARTNVLQVAVRRHKVSPTAACKTRIVSWKGLVCD